MKTHDAADLVAGWPRATGVVRQRTADVADVEARAPAVDEAIKACRRATVGRMFISHRRVRGVPEGPVFGFMTTPDWRGT